MRTEAKSKWAVGGVAAIKKTNKQIYENVIRFIMCAVRVRVCASVYLWSNTRSRVGVSLCSSLYHCCERIANLTHSRVCVYPLSAICIIRCASHEHFELCWIRTDIATIHTHTAPAAVLNMVYIHSNIVNKVSRASVAVCNMPAHSFYRNALEQKTRIVIINMSKRVNETSR